MSLKSKIIATVVAFAATFGYAAVALQTEPVSIIKPAYDGFMCRVIVGWSWDSVNGGYNPIYGWKWCRYV